MILVFCQLTDRFVSGWYGNAQADSFGLRVWYPLAYERIYRWVSLGCFLRALSKRVNTIIAEMKPRSNSRKSLRFSMYLMFQRNRATSHLLPFWDAM